MKADPRQQAVSRSRSREGRIEATGHARRVRSATDLTNSPHFDLQYDEWKGGRPADFYRYQYRGYIVKLRFNYMWMAYCPKLKIEKHFLNQTPKTLAEEINDWLDAHIAPPATSPQAKLRQSTRAVQELADRHEISINVADEIMLERGR